MSLLQVTEDDLDALKLKFQNALGEGYEVETNKEVSALWGYIKETFDLVVFYHGDAICGIEYKYKFRMPLFMERYQDLYINRLKSVGLKFGIEYYGEKQDIYFWSKESYKFEVFSFDNIVTAIKGNQACGERLKPLDLIADFSDFMSDDFKYEMKSNRITKLQSLFTEDNLVYEEKSGSIWLKQEIEDEFFKTMLQKDDKVDDYKHVCRYTSLQSLFLTMKDANQVMCSITCMNDKGETSYADKYVGYGAFAESESSIKENNDCFILSCCNETMMDNLTMWRLYGNDGKGVCLEYEVDQNKIDDKEFFMASVSYGKTLDEHPVLDFIREIRHWKKNGWGFELKRWYIWKHFFKSHLFKDENEVRLLFVWTDKSGDKVEWIMDSTNNIVSRICKFPISGERLPLTLKAAIIGPKCPEQGSNVAQFNYMNRQLKTMAYSLTKPAIKASKIEDYR